MLKREKAVYQKIGWNVLKIYVSFILEPAHAKSHAQTTSVRKAANDKAREDRALARDYQKKKAERRKSWLRSVIKLHKEQTDSEPDEVDKIPVEDNTSTGILSPLKPQQLNFGSTSGEAEPPPIPNTPIILTPILQSPLPPPIVLQLPPMANPVPNPNPRITNVVHIPYFLGRPGADPDTHVAKFELTCNANSIPPAKLPEVFAASLQEEAFAWYLRQPVFADWNALKNAFLDHFRPLGFASSLKEKLPSRFPEGAQFHTKIKIECTLNRLHLISETQIMAPNNNSSQLNNMPTLDFKK